MRTLSRRHTRLLLGTVAVLAGPAVPAANDLDGRVAGDRARAEAAYEALVSSPRPGPARAGRDAGKDCVQLWNERLALLGDTYHYQVPLYDDPRLWVAQAVSFVFLPAIAYVGVATLTRVKEKDTRHEAHERIQELAQASAERACFDRG
jgi:hypothetical protein